MKTIEEIDKKIEELKGIRDKDIHQTSGNPVIDAFALVASLEVMQIDSMIELLNWVKE